MNRELAVYLDLDGVPVRCGRLWTRSAPREGASFEYDDGYRARRGAFALAPDLPLGAGSFHTARPIFRAFSDPAPDRWGQMLLRRAERARTRREKRAPICGRRSYGASMRVVGSAVCSTCQRCTRA